MERPARERNEAQELILEYLYNRGPATSLDIANDTDLDKLQASVYLHDYYSTGYLYRKKDGKTFQYSVSERGKERLDALKDEGIDT